MHSSEQLEIICISYFRDQETKAQKICLIDLLIQRPEQGWKTPDFSGFYTLPEGVSYKSQDLMLITRVTTLSFGIARPIISQDIF